MKRWSILPLLVGLILGTTGCSEDRMQTPDASTDAGTAPDAYVPPGVDAGPLPPTAFRAVTWNVENFFDEVNDPGSGDPRLSRSEVEAKMAMLADVLREIDADFVALQEVEKLPLLERLADGPLAELGYTERGLIDTRDVREIAYLSRVPVTNVISHAGERIDPPPGEDRCCPDSTGGDCCYWTRDALEVFVRPGGHNLGIAIVHFISQLEASNDTRRAAQGNALRELVEGRVTAGFERFMVLGDLNDTPRSDTLRYALNGAVLQDATSEIPSSQRYTYTFRNNRQQLDYALTTQALEPMVTGARIVHGSAVEAASDHSPVVIDLMLQ